MNILQVTVVLEVPHHILLWAHYRVTTPVSVCRPRVRPRRYAPGCENCKAKCQVRPPGGDECQTERKITSERKEKDKENDKVYLERLRFRFRTRDGIKCYWLRYVAVGFLSKWRGWRQWRSRGGVPRRDSLRRDGRVTVATIDNGGRCWKWERWPRRRGRCAR